MRDFQGKKVAIIGAGRSGQAAAFLIARLKGKVCISESGPQETLPAEFQSWIKEHQIESQFNGHTQDFIENNDLLVLSPGVKIDAEPVEWARKKGILVIGEIELAYRFCPCPIIAVTGSNGKTTVVTLITEMLQKAGKKVQLCGNVGSAFSQYVLDLQSIDYVILEISSFQLETIKYFKPHVAVFLNFSQNHLDRHKDLQEYLAAKKRIFLNQDQKDYAILNAKDETLMNLGYEIHAKVLYFNSSEQLITSPIKNPNYLAAQTAVSVLGVSPQICQKVFQSFQGVEHRMERVRTMDGVEYINDSKSTTAEATRWALETLQKPVILICGGKDKNIDFSVLQDLIRKKVKSMVVIGEAKTKLKQTFDTIVHVQVCHKLDEAVEWARDYAKQGDCILLSPMCASFDMFKNFEERGKIFKEIVNSLYSGKHLIKSS